MQGTAIQPPKPAPDTCDLETNPYVLKSKENLDNARELSEQKAIGAPEFKQDEEIDFIQAEIDAQA